MKSIKRLIHRLQNPREPLPEELRETKPVPTAPEALPLVTQPNPTNLEGGIKSTLNWLGMSSTLSQSSQPSSPINTADLVTRVANNDLAAPVVRIDRENITLEDLYAGFFVSGGTGSGKTSTTGQLIAKSAMKAGFGALVLTVKGDECAEWTRWAEQCGRGADVVRVSIESLDTDRPTVFDFASEELNRTTRGAAMIENLVGLIMTIMEIAQRKHGAGKGDDFFERAAQQLLRNAVQILSLAHRRISIIDILQVMKEAPQTPDLIEKPIWQAGSRCFQALVRAQEIVSQPREEGGRPELTYDVQLAQDYFLKEFPTLAERTRSSITATVSTLLDAFARHGLRELFACDGRIESTVRPSDAWTQGKIIIIDLPVLDFNDTGVYAQQIWKYCFQGAVQQRGSTGCPVLLYADEAQHFLVQKDQLFATTARSSRCATVYMTQNISNFYAKLGGDSAGKNTVDSLMGNFQCRVFHQNLDAEQNEWVAKSITKMNKWMMNFQFNPGSIISAFSGEGGLQSPVTGGVSQQMQDEVLPRVFTTYRTGGPSNNFKADACLVVKGRILSGGKRWQKITLDQQVISRF